MKHSLLKKFTCTFLAFVLAFALAGCAQEKPPEETPEADAPFFIVWPGPGWGIFTGILVDAQGNEVMQAAHMGYTSFENSHHTPQGARFVVLTQDDYSTSALYAPDGTLLFDFANYSYTTAFGDFVLRHAGNSTDLLNAYTGEVLYENISTISVIDETCVAIYGEEYTIIAVVGFEGNVLEGFPTGFSFIELYKKDGLFIAFSSEGDAESCIIMNEQFEIISPMHSGHFLYTSNQYILMETGGVTYVIDTEAGEQVIKTSTGEVVFEGTGLTYYDGDVYIRSVGLWENRVNYLHSIDGTLLASTTDYFLTLPATETSSARHYYLVDGTNIIRCINSNGEVLAEREFSEEVGYASRLLQGNILVISAVNAESGYHQDLLVDENLQPFGTQDIAFNSVIDCYGNEGYYIGWCTEENGGSLPVSYLLDSNGGIAVGSIDHFCYSVEGYMIVWEEGFAGVMDLEGNWLYQTELVLTTEA